MLNSDSDSELTRYQTPALSDMEMIRLEHAAQAYCPVGDTVISQTHALTFQTR